MMSLDKKSSLESNVFVQIVVNFLIQYLFKKIALKINWEIWFSNNKNFFFIFVIFIVSNLVLYIFQR